MPATVPRETSALFGVYKSLLERWNARINLVAPATLKDVEARHFRDSAQLWKLRERGAAWVDLGSGGGFPGMVIAILNFVETAGYTVHLVESDRRKAAFLRTVSRETGVPVVVHDRRAEDLHLQADIISARALAPLDQLLGYAAPLLAPGGVCLFPKGEKAVDEIEEALEHWAFDVESFPSETSPNARILKIRNIQPRSAQPHA